MKAFIDRRSASAYFVTAALSESLSVTALAITSCEALASMMRCHFLDASRDRPVLERPMVRSLP